MFFGFQRTCLLSICTLFTTAHIYASDNDFQANVHLNAFLPAKQPDGLKEKFFCCDDLRQCCQGAPPGSRGPRGKHGSIGPVGHKGDKGPKGREGARGPRGATGATGARGATGATGATGASQTPIVASYSIPWPPGALGVDTYAPLPFVDMGLNANFPAVGGITLDATTHIFTIPVDGYYEISYGYSSFWNSGTIVGLGIFTGVVPLFNHIVPNSSISQGIGAQYQMTSGNIVIPLLGGAQIALINTNNGGPPPDGNVPTDFEGLAPYPALNTQGQTAAYITIKKVGDL